MLHCGWIISCDNIHAVLSVQEPISRDIIHAVLWVQELCWVVAGKLERKHVTEALIVAWQNPPRSEESTQTRTDKQHQLNPHDISNKANLAIDTEAGPLL